MSFEADLKTKLSTIEAVGNKVYPLNAPEGTTAPYIVYVSQNIDEIQTLNGFIGRGWLECEINLLTPTYSQLKTLSKAVRDKLKTFDSFLIDNPQPELYEAEVNLYRTIINIKIFKEE